jgi:hypothetical protein
VTSVVTEGSDRPTAGGRGALAPSSGVAVRVADSLGNRRALALVALAAAASAIVHLLAGLQLGAPWITPDELIYSELAKSLADGSLPGVRGEATLGYGLLYPLTIAPAWALFDDPAHAYVAAKAINAVVMALAAFPAYFLARRFVTVPSAVLVGALSAFVPSVLLSGTLLIEVVLYPVFLLALLGLVAALQEPTRRNQLLAIGGIALACLAKPLSVVLAPAYVLAVLQLALLDRRSGGSVRARLRQHATSLGALGGIAAAALLGSLLLGDPDAVLGVYGVVVGNIDVSGMLVWLVWHFAGLDLSVAVVPFAASLVLIALAVGRARDGDARVREFGALATWTIGGTLLAIAAYASKPLAGAAGYIPSEARLHERNMFVLAPILLVGLALFIERRRPASTWLRAGSVAVAVALPLLLPLERLLTNATFQAPVVIPWTTGGIERFWPYTFLPLAALAAVVLLGPPERLARRAWVIVGVAFAVTTLAAHASMTHPGGAPSSKVGIGSDTRWIDRAVPRGTAVTALWVGRADNRSDVDPRAIWMSEFYNRSVEEVVEVGRPMPYELPHREGRIADGTLRDAGGAPITAEYLLAPCSVSVEGRVVASDRRAGARLYRLPAGPIRVADAPSVLACEASDDDA